MKYLAPLIVAIAGIGVGACLANKTKPQVLFPAAELAWPAVSEDFARGLQDGLQDGDLAQPIADMLTVEGEALGRALKSKDLAVVKTILWYSMEPWSERGIQDKLDDLEIGPGVATSLREQLTKFTEVITKLQTIQ